MVVIELRETLKVINACLLSYGSKWLSTINETITELKVFKILKTAYYKINCFAKSREWEKKNTLEHIINTNQKEEQKDKSPCATVLNILTSIIFEDNPLFQNVVSFSEIMTSCYVYSE